MFEKEAEDFADSKKSFWRQGKTCIESVIQAYQKGAEYGYKKCQEEMQKNGLALQSDMDETIRQNFELKARIEKMTDTETMLKILKDRGVIRSWYYNGTYHVGNELQDFIKAHKL